MTKYLQESFSVQYNAKGYNVFIYKEGGWKLKRTLFDYQKEEFEMDNKRDLELGWMKIIKDEDTP